MPKQDLEVNSWGNGLQTGNLQDDRSFCCTISAGPKMSLALIFYIWTTKLHTLTLENDLLCCRALCPTKVEKWCVSAVHLSCSVPGSHWFPFISMHTGMYWPSSKPGKISRPCWLQRSPIYLWWERSVASSVIFFPHWFFTKSRPPVLWLASTRYFDVSSDWVVCVPYELHYYRRFCSIRAIHLST